MSDATQAEIKTHRELYLRARVELFYLICTILQTHAPEWTPTAQLVAGLAVSDVLGWERIASATPEAKAEVENLYADVLPMCREVLGLGVPFQKRKVIH